MSKVIKDFKKLIDMAEYGELCMNEVNKAIDKISKLKSPISKGPVLEILNELQNNIRIEIDL